MTHPPRLTWTTTPLTRTPLLVSTTWFPLLRTRPLPPPKFFHPTTTLWEGLQRAVYMLSRSRLPAASPQPRRRRSGRGARRRSAYMPSSNVLKPSMRPSTRLTRQHTRPKIPTCMIRPSPDDKVTTPACSPDSILPASEKFLNTAAVSSPRDESGRKGASLSCKWICTGCGRVSTEESWGMCPICHWPGPEPDPYVRTHTRWSDELYEDACGTHKRWLAYGSDSDCDSVCEAITSGGFLPCGDSKWG